MARQRLTTRKLVASPDAFSGRNFNSPVMLYDTHPNKRFVVGEDVIPISGGAIKGMPVRGQVLGHAAEDRLWVKWPTEIAQEDVSDVMALREYEYGGSTQARLKGPQASRAASREVFADFLELENEMGSGEEGNGEDETEEAQELIFATLPEEQNPEEEIDLESDGSDEVTLLDLGSVCDDEYDQTNAIEEALEESDFESQEGELDALSDRVARSWFL